MGKVIQLQVVEGNQGVSGQKVTMSGSGTDFITNADGCVSLLLDDGTVAIQINNVVAYNGASGSLKAKERFSKDGQRLAA